jgi:cytochrome c oxidase cbb3-type subunit I/II
LVTLLWGAVGMLVGLLIALQLAVPELNFAPYLTFGGCDRSTPTPSSSRSRQHHLRGGLLLDAAPAQGPAFTRPAVKDPLLGLAAHHRVAAASRCRTGITQGKEYAELEWPIDLSSPWSGWPSRSTSSAPSRNRRERHLYVALWFYIATIVTVAILHIFNNIVIPAGLFKSYSAYSGVQDAFMQWWYGHNAVAFFLTTPFLGLMYYFLPKAAERPVFSYRLSILHFWSLVFIYIWAGPHHLHYSALPEWASTLGMIFSVDAVDAVVGRHDQRPAHAARRVAQGAPKSRSSSSSWWHHLLRHVDLRGADDVDQVGQRAVALHRLEHRPRPRRRARLGRLHLLRHDLLAGAALYQTSCTPAPGHRTSGSPPWASSLYVVSMWVAGITQGLMWRAFDDTGRLQYPDFLETVTKLMPMYWVRVLGGTLYIAGLFIGVYNMYKTWQSRPKTYAEPEVAGAADGAGARGGGGTWASATAAGRACRWSSPC